MRGLNSDDPGAREVAAGALELILSEVSDRTLELPPGARAERVARRPGSSGPGLAPAAVAVSHLGDRSRPIAALAAATRAIGTRYGEQLT